MAEPPVSCFHCGEPCTVSPPVRTQRAGESLDFCCQGCAAVSAFIFSSGLGRYYQFRTGEARVASDDLEALEAAWRACDEREDWWGEDRGAGLRELLLQTEGVHCAACAWLIRSRLEPLAGVRRVVVDLASGYTRIDWEPARIRLSQIAVELARIGYKPHLPLSGEEERGRLNERRTALVRVGVAGLGMMQVMMYAVGLYAGEAMGISAGAERFLEWTSLLVTVPVVLYAGRPFFDNAARSLAARRVGMDVPVALAIGVAFVASTVNFLRGEGAVYFDSVVMFIFFLSAARYAQLAQRHRNLQAGAALARLLPEWARRIDAEGETTVLAADLRPGDRVRIPAGEPFPADGRLLSGETSVDEALLTGESRPCRRTIGEAVVGGSINLSQPVDIEVTARPDKGTVSVLGRLLMRARGTPSRLTSLSERLAGAFVTAVLLIATVAGLAWYTMDSQQVLPTVLAVLVVSCPCALSLATPTALAAASRRLLREGLLVCRPDALESLAQVDAVVFDKTGTLTAGRPGITGVRIMPGRNAVSETQALQVAAALEAHSAHPLAHAFAARAGLNGLVATAVEEQSHEGLAGVVDGKRWALGRPQWAGAPAGTQSDGWVWLGDEFGPVARFELSDTLRRDAATTLNTLQAGGLAVSIASGDAPATVAGVAAVLGIDDWQAGLDPEQKMAHVRDRQAGGHRVLMVGDGVNDAPVLAVADVSMTVAGATELANSAADLILTGDSLEGVGTALETARATRRIIVQNLTWALGYNALALPLAVSGWLQPWMAALGMSLSSLLVVANAARLGRASSARPAGHLETGVEAPA